jgi:hypothetical protein
MPTTYAIPDGRVAMAATLYTGTGASQTISNAVNGVSFQPDFVWVKGRSFVSYNGLIDSVRGRSSDLYSNATIAEETSGSTEDLTSFNSNGFSLGTPARFGSNTSGQTYVAWQWKAGGTAVSNTAGSITSSVSANTTAGFSVVTWTGTNTAATIGHGLGVAPAMYITKQRSATGNWFTYHVSVGNTKGLFLDLTNASTTNTYFNNTSPTSTVFSIGSGVGGLNASGVTQVTYCFAPVAGYSAFGSYVGNGSNDGPFIYTGFRPRFLLIKNTTTAGTNWEIWDSARDLYNVESNRLYPDSSAAENGGQNAYDFLSNGFKARQGGSTDTNQSGATIIYMAFAEMPFKFANSR